MLSVIDKEYVVKNNNFESYTSIVDFQGLKLPLPNIYRYITRDENNFIHAWRSKPSRDFTFGGWRGDNEMPITLGYHKGVGLKPIAINYRRSDGRLISENGVVVE